MTEMVLVKGERSKLLWANRTFRDYYGLSNEELAALIDAEHSDPDDTLQYVRDDHQVWTTGEMLEVTEPVTRADGVVGYFDTVKTAIVEGGEVTRTVGVSRLTHEDSGAAETRAERKLRAETLRNVVDMIPVPVALLDAKMRIVANSNAFASICPLPTMKDAFYADALGTLFPFEAQIEEVIETGQPYSEDDVEATLNGELRFFDLRIGPWRLPADQTGGAVLVLTDVTELRRRTRELAEANRVLESQAKSLQQAQTELRARHHELESILDVLSVGVVVANHDGELTLWNQEASNVLGVGASEPSHWSEQVGFFDEHGERLSSDALPLTRAMKGERVRDATMLVRSPSLSNDRWLTVSATPLTDLPRHAAAVVFTDISERVSVQQELEEFAYVASHDLQEPLRMVKSYVELLNDEYGSSLDGEAREYMKFVVDGARRMQQLVRDLLDLSRTRRRELTIEPVDLTSVVERSIGDLALLKEESSATIDREPLPTVKGDPSQLHQLLLNLIGNALKFRDPARPLRVSIRAADLDNSWRIEVEDNGIGMNPKYAPKAFRMFQRLHGVGEYPGTGIGLAVCKRIVERHGGQLGVDSELGIGSTFWFTLLKEQRNGAV